MTKTLWIDIETRSRVDLKKYGVYPYVRCPDFKILMGSWEASWLPDPVTNVESEQGIHDIPGLWDPKVLKVAHNAQFERVCFSVFNERHRHGMELGEHGYLDPEHWEDTQALASVQGYPKSLEKCARALGADPKDEAGTRLINLFCKPNRQGGWNGPDTHPMEWLEFIAYCDQDVVTLKDVHERLLAQGGWPTEMERRVFIADQTINDRGIRIDLDLAREAVKVGQSNALDQKERIRQITKATGLEVENAGSVQQMGRWLKHRGEGLENLRAETVEKALLYDLPDDVREVLELRQELALAAPAKFATALAANVDGRLHGTLKYGGAHTLRWAGRGTQVQNLPRLSFTTVDPVTGKEVYDEVAQDAAIVDLLLGLGADAPTLKKLVRPLFVGPFTVVDYKAIEAVVIAWLAGEEWVLQSFRENRDIYVETAERMGGLTRAQGKIAVLALGFNGGPGSLKAMAGGNDSIVLTGEYAGKHRNLMAKEGGVDPEAPENARILDMSDEMLYELFVYPWRDANANIAKMWKVLDARFRTGGPVGDHISFEKANGNRDRLLRLPSGRAIAYRKAGIQHRKKWSERKQEWVDREVLTFSSVARYPGRDDTYGGRLAENVTQAVARDLMAEAIVRLEAAGYPVVAHVHDEIIVEGEHDLDEMSKIMFELPEWAAGMPVSGEGFTCRRYKKG